MASRLRKADLEIGLRIAAKRRACHIAQRTDFERLAHLLLLRMARQPRKSPLSLASPCRWQRFTYAPQIRSDLRNKRWTKLSHFRSPQSKSGTNPAKNPTKSTLIFGVGVP